METATSFANARPHRDLCPEADARDAMSEPEFWAPEDPDLYAPDDLDLCGGQPCPTCGADGACGYDAEGRALIHVTETGDSDGLG